MTTAPLTLLGQRVELVPLTFHHLDALCEIGLAPELWSATTIRVQSRADMRAYIEHALELQAAGTAVPFVIVERNSGHVVGSTRFHSLAPEHRKLEVGFTFIAITRQRTGINTEAKYLMLRYAFESWDCIRVQFTANAANQKSRAALLGLGAVEEALFRQHRISPHLGVCDLAVYGIIAPEWPAIRARLEAKLEPK